MKVAALALGFAALALGAFAVWTFGYRGAGQRARVEAYVEALESTVAPKRATTVTATPQSRGLWRATIHDATAADVCVIVDPARLDAVFNKGSWQFHGIINTEPCP